MSLSVNSFKLCCRLGKWKACKQNGPLSFHRIRHLKKKAPCCQVNPRYGDFASDPINYPLLFFLYLVNCWPISLTVNLGCCHINLLCSQCRTPTEVKERILKGRMDWSGHELKAKPFHIIVEAPFFSLPQTVDSSWIPTFRFHSSHELLYFI